MSNSNAPRAGQFRPRLDEYRITEMPVTVRNMLAKRLLRAIRAANVNDRRAAHRIAEFAAASPSSTSNSEAEITDDEDVPQQPLLAMRPFNDAERLPFGRYAVDIERAYEAMWRSHAFLVFVFIFAFIVYLMIFY